MKPQSRKLFHRVIALAGVAFLLSGSTAAVAQQAESQVMTTTTSDTEQAPKLPNDELDSLVAPIALYSDPLLAQTLAASTYPLEIIQLQQWMDRNKNLQGKALADAVAKQPWDPSVQALVATPAVVQRMAGNIQWTTDLGNAFLGQQSDVMDAVQRMRGKAENKGTLKTSAQQTVQTKTVEGGKQVIVVEPAQPDVVYVPSYDPEVVYGAPPPAYPYYPYTYPGYVPGTALAWGAGIALGAAAWGAWGGNWGNCDWNHGDVNINNNNNFNRNANRNVNRNVNRGQAGQGNKWQHNPQHRGNAPYGNRQTANKFGGTARGQGGRQPGTGTGARPGGGTGAGARPGGGGAGTRPGGGGAAARPGGGAAGARPGGGGAGTRPGGGGAGARPGGGGAGAKPSTRPAGGSAKNQIGNRSASSRPSSASRGGGGFGGGGSGNYARASSNRGGHSMGGGGMSRGGGGGGRGGGGRGGGGGGRR
jgi:Protein of unknown function (DUF3300)